MYEAHFMEAYTRSEGLTTIMKVSKGRKLNGKADMQMRKRREPNCQYTILSNLVLSSGQERKNRSKIYKMTKRK